MTMQLMPLVIFWAIVAAFLVCGCILTRKPTKKPPVAHRLGEAGPQ